MAAIIHTAITCNFLLDVVMALTSPTGGGRSVGMVRSRTKATEFSLVLVVILTELYKLEI